MAISTKVPRKRDSGTLAASVANGVLLIGSSVERRSAKAPPVFCAPELAPNSRKLAAVNNGS